MLIVITSPETTPDETVICNALFARGLKLLHLRKPGAPEKTYENFIRRIDSRYHCRIVTHDHYGLVEKYQLRGIHLKSGQFGLAGNYAHLEHVSISCHSVDEIRQLPFRPAYCFLSPLFDSISKQGYRSSFADLPDVGGLPCPVVALGGITPEKLSLCHAHGFAGAAVLGYIWEKNSEAIGRFLRLSVPEVMSIAGFDPSSGAGITADTRTFESCGSYGLGVCSAITFQNETEYSGTEWTTTENILRQCQELFRKHRPEVVKIGLIHDFTQLDQVTDYLTTSLPGVRIIWDPILKASAGFCFHNPENSGNKGLLSRILNRIYLITPNTGELRTLFGDTTNPEKLQELCRSHNVNLLWKGGHNHENLSTDRLITPEGIHTFSVERGDSEKHGTGCVLSAAATAFLAQGHSLADACDKAQLYVSAFIDSNDSMLGYHTISHAPSLPPPMPGELSLQYISDHKEGMSVCEQIDAVCRGGIRWVQLRMKDADDREMLRTGRLAAEICRSHNALFIINDRVQIARQLNADGVHLGKEDVNPQEARRILGPEKIIGATCNTWEDIQERARQGVDYIGLGPFTFTATKKKLSPVLGLEGYTSLLRQMNEAGIRIPVFAIGGITETDISPLMHTGIQGIALSGLIKNSDDLTLQTRNILNIINLKH